jgi:hypothetical protein
VEHTEEIDVENIWKSVDYNTGDGRFDDVWAMVVLGQQIELKRKLANWFA